MSGLVVGITIGCFAGAIGTLLLLLLIHSIPDDGEVLRISVSGRWRAVASVVAMTVVTGVFFTYVGLHQVAFATSMFLLLIFVSAQRHGVLVSYVTLAIATLVLCLILPPARTFIIASPKDQMLLAYFVVCGAGGARLIAQNQIV